ncbi:reprolysin-like metallopeptidase [Nonlabens sp.]|uniref:reprolysin-like metallopeptidase n=1 Tax=Nonlabens sp. TaxID=1888209 RepID=UPI001BCF1DA9|nr:zinc-dependent metalloprotease family protein [Nonlabens sp.]
MNRILFFTCLLLFPFFNTAQVIWESVDQQEVAKVTSEERGVQPSAYHLVRLNTQALTDKLVVAQDRFSASNGIAIDFPTATDTFETFSVYNSGTVSKELQVQYPNIKSYVGKSQQNPLNTIYFTLTPQGFRGLITGENISYMDPYAKSVPNIIMSYDRKDLSRAADDDFSCGVDDGMHLLNTSSFTGMETKAFRDRQLRTYRLAVAATAEYTAYHDDGNAGNGSAVADAIAGIVTTITRVNSVFEKEMSIRFTLVGNNGSLIYTDSNTDPYDNYSGGQMIGVNTSIINGQIGSAAYDIGHVFSTGGGGIASASRCNNFNKGRGVTGIVTPEFDPFDIDYVSHEIGHQFGASHTFYNGCFGGSPSSQPYETGSASTIMGYAGICAPNVQDNSDAYFHAISLQEMHATMALDTCDDQISLGSNNPTAPDAQNLVEKFMPIATPFKLTASSSVPPDAGEVYTYRWDQLDTGAAAATGATQPPLSSSTSGPMFRSKFATTDPTRYFPNLEEVLNGADDIWETLSSVTREMTFVATIYDNNFNGGQTDQAEVIVKPTTAAGPFRVNAPVATDIWHEGETKTVAWDVANTNQPALAEQVNVKLSLDGGYTYPIMLASNVPNSGTVNVTIPTGAKTVHARILVEAVGNYFYNVNNGTFEIKEGSFELTATTDDFSVCQPSDGTTTFEYNAAPDFNESVTFSALGLPAGLTATFTPSSTTADATVSISISGTAAVAANQYDFSVAAQSTSVTLSKNLTFKLFDNLVGNILQIAPVNGAANQVANPLLQWEDLASASSYLVEISENSDFSIITESHTVFFQNSYQPTTLVHSAIYYWRVTPSNDCTSGTVASISLFQTAQEVCTTYDNETYENTAQPANRQDEWNTSINAVAAKVVVTDDIEVTKLSYYMNATHGDTGHIKMQLSAPTGRFAEVYNRECASGVNFDLVVSDDGTQNFGCAPGYTGALTGNQRPGQAFTRFNDASALGEWVLLATDRTAGTGGTFNQFSVTVCGRLQYVNDIETDLNLGLTTSFNATNVINNSSLRSVQAGFTAANLVYVVTNDVDFGQIQLNGVDLNIGDTFTQGDIDNNRIQYVHTSLELVSADSFGYSVLGNANTVLLGKVFTINIEDPTLIYDAGVWTPFAPHAETGSLNAQVVSGTAPVAVDATINDLSVTAGVLSIASNAVLTVNGNLSVVGELDGTQGTLRLNGSSAQSISGAGSLELHILEVNNPTGVSFGALTNIYYVLRPQASVLNTTNTIVFKSNATTTGQLDDASAATINGSVRVERYIPAKRAFRFLASSVNSTGTIRENWQENGAVVAGLGTHITGPSASNGFDVNASGAYSLYTFDNDNYTWSVVPNTNIEQLVIGAPLRIMVRGDRTTDLTNNNAQPSVTILRASGSVHTGDYSRSYSTVNGGFAMVSNPYQAAVDFKNVLNDVATSGLNTNFVYVWDPTLNTRGAYATVDMSTLNGTAFPGSSAANKFLQPGQSVFVPATGVSGWTFKESHKAVDQPITPVFGAYHQNHFITISLKDASGIELIDQATMQYGSSFSNSVTQEDAVKFVNLDETLAFTTGSDQLSIERRQLPMDGDITPIYLSNYRSNSYIMDLEVALNAGLTAILVDQELGTRRLLQDGHNALSFSVGASGSMNNRFLIEYADGTLSVEENSLINSIAVYPNPIENNSFQVSSTYLLGKEVQLSMYNALGQNIYERVTFFTDIQRIKPSVVLRSGVYLLKVSTREESATVQLIVK